MENFDSNTLELLNELRKKHKIDFEERDVEYCEVFQQNGNAVIYYNPNLFSSSSITHELLHIWLHKFEYVIGNHLYLSCLSHPKLAKIFNKFLCDFITNFFDHNKMYPKYIEMGYSPESFILNGLEEKCSIVDINHCSLKFLNVYNANSINFYIGCLLSIYADHVENNYQEHLKLLKSKDNQLFEIVTKYWESWLAFDIYNIDRIFNSSYELTANFINAMNYWVENKKIK